jgi:hypothetical protein
MQNMLMGAKLLKVEKQVDGRADGRTDRLDKQLLSQRRERT